MKMNCLHCGHAFGVDDSYCDYEGLLKCPTCAGLLDARIEDGLIKSVRPGSFGDPVTESTLERLQAEVRGIISAINGARAAETAHRPDVHVAGDPDAGTDVETGTGPVPGTAAVSGVGRLHADRVGRVA